MRRYDCIILSSLLISACHGETKTGPLFDTALLLPQAGASPSRANTPANPDANAYTTDGTVINSVIEPATCKPFDTPQTAPSAATSPLQTRESRNECMWALIGMIDQKYIPYRAGLRSLATGTAAVADILSLGLTSAATAAGGAATKTILSAINTGVIGSKTALDTDYLYNKSIDIVTNQMDADRSEQLTSIIKNMNNEVATYGMTQAKDDLLQYYAKGTFASALESLTSKTASNATTCENEAKTAKAAMSAGQSGTASAADATAADQATTSGCNTASAMPATAPALTGTANPARADATPGHS